MVYNGYTSKKNIKTRVLFLLKKKKKDILALAFPCISGPDINMTLHLSSSVHTDFYFKTFHITFILASAPQNIISSSFFPREAALSLPLSISWLSFVTLSLCVSKTVSRLKGGWYCKLHKNQTEYINNNNFKNPLSYLQRVAWSPVDTYSSTCPVTSITTATTICINNCKITYKRLPKSEVQALLQNHYLR